MNPNDVGRTAHWIAAVRAMETQRESPLFKDAYAERLAGNLGAQLKANSDVAAGVQNQFIIVRTKYFDDFIQAASGSCPQVVLLGAGFDTRVYRLELNNTKVFEVDQSEVINEKERILRSDVPGNGNTIVRVSADLRESWVEKLYSNGFDINVPTVWVLEGLLYYLYDSSVKEIIESINQCSAVGSCIIFDVFGTGLLEMKQMSTFVDNQLRKGLPLPYCNDRPEDLFLDFKEWKMAVDYCGSESANYGRVKTYYQDITRSDRSKLNSYFVCGMKGG